MVAMKTYLILLATTLLVQYAHAHGRLLVPPARNTLWRENTKAPVMHTDNQLNCGGWARQHETNNGRCGVCGDAYDDVKPLFIPPSGTFATGIVGRCYLTGTRYLSATVQLTSSHLGYFDFRLCVNNDFQKPVTQDCLDKTVLQIEDPDGVRIGTQYNITNFRPITLELQVLLPPGIRCTQCVLQWRYVAGNNWGCEGSGQKKRCGLGLGPQETFVNCADIAILESCTS